MYLDHDYDANIQTLFDICIGKYNQSLHNRYF